MITKEEFFKAYNTYPPSWFLVQFYRFFGRTVALGDKWLALTVQSFWFFLIITGIFFAAIQAVVLLKISVFAIVFTLVPFGITYISVGIVNSLRLRKIRKLLGLSKSQYVWFADQYL